MNRTMILIIAIIVTALVAGFIGHRMGKKSAMKSLNGTPSNGGAEDEPAETTTE